MRFNLLKSFKISLLFLSIFSLGSCGDDEVPAVGTSKVVGLDYGFCNEALINDDSEITLENELFTKPTKFDVEEKYYLVINYTVVTTSLTSPLKGAPLVEMELTFSNSSFINGSKYSSDAPTQKEQIKDPTTGDNGFRFVTDSKIINEINQQITFKIVVLFLTVRAGESYLTCNITGINTNITVTEGTFFEKILIVQKEMLEAPIISYSSSSWTLSWTHVKKCEYYCLYIDGIESNLKYPESPAVDLLDLLPNTLLDWNLNYDELLGVHRVRLQSCNSNTVNFQNSPLSNEVEVIL